jgi:hypothetical protein
MKAWMLCGLFAAGCGSTGIDLSNATVDQACGDIAQARCAKEKACSNGTSIIRTWGDMSTCLARQKLQCTLALAAPMNSNTPAATEKCVAAFAHYSCNDYYNNNPPADCVHLGVRPSGAPCAFDGQCQDSYCLGIKTATCGTCGDAPPEGASCRDSNCARGQECDSRTRSCVTAGAEGDPCDNNSAPCAADLQCAGMMGTCMKTSASSGAACSSSLFCDGWKGLACGPSHTCSAIPYGADGAACGSIPGETFSECAGAGACYTATGIALSGEMGNCRAAAADGAACDITVGPPCLSPARCVVTGGGNAGICTLPSGDTCG